MEEIIRVENLKKYFPAEQSLLERIKGGSLFIKAVDGISFGINKGESFALVGESGSGKTTAGKLMIKLLEPTEGRIIFNNQDITNLKGEKLRKIRRYMQMIFQDPYASLNPRMKIIDIIIEPLIEHGICNKEEAKEEVKVILEKIGLTPWENFITKYPHQLSGGQRQRVAIARAMILKPKFVVADEPVSMIDVSLRISILELLESFRKEINTAIMLITHDISVASLIANRMGVMYLGKIVEIGALDEIINNPSHPYTLALLSSIPSPRKKIKSIKITEEIPDPKNPPKGCRFHPRCPFATEKCKKEEPPLIEVSKGHFSACHYAFDIKLYKFLNDS